MTAYLGDEQVLLYSSITVRGMEHDLSEKKASPPAGC